MTYHCEQCHFVFQRVGKVETCPLCNGIQLQMQEEILMEKLQKIAEEERTSKE